LHAIVAQYVSYEVFVIIVLGPEHGDQRLGMRSVAIFGILMAAAPVFAQNGFSATYDSARQVTFKGPVTTIQWTNPHAFIWVNVEDAFGVLTSWAAPGFEIVDMPDLKRVFILNTAGPHTWKVVYMDGRTHLWAIPSAIGNTTCW
jgi:hypothetical protein